MKTLSFIAVILSLAFSGAVYADHGHDAGNPNKIKDAKCEKSGKPALTFRDDDDKTLFDKIKTGKITGTLRSGTRCFDGGAKAIDLVKYDADPAKALPFAKATLVEEPYYIKLKDVALNEATAVNAAGFNGIKDPVEAAKAQFKHYYKDATDDTVLTVIKFKVTGN